MKTDGASTTQLLSAAAAGDDAAREALIARHLPRLRRWAHGRLPAHGRDLAETDDLVQITLLRALNRLEDFDSRRPGALLAYLRTILMNLVRDEIRRSARRPEQFGLREDEGAAEPSTIEAAVGHETLEAYEAALQELDEDKRLAVIMRVEFDMGYEEIAEELEKPSANAARVMIVRALAQLSRAMGR